MSVLSGYTWLPCTSTTTLTTCRLPQESQFAKGNSQSSRRMNMCLHTVSSTAYIYYSKVWQIYTKENINSGHTSYLFFRLHPGAHGASFWESFLWPYTICWRGAQRPHPWATVPPVWRSCHWSLVLLRLKGVCVWYLSYQGAPDYTWQHEGMTALTLLLPGSPSTSWQSSWTPEACNVCGRDIYCHQLWLWLFKFQGSIHSSLKHMTQFTAM